MRNRFGRLVVVLCLLSVSSSCRLGLLLLILFVEGITEGDAHSDSRERDWW